MACKGVCGRLPGYNKSPRFFHSRGMLFCATCMMSYKATTRKCECCNTNLRFSSFQHPHAD